jgi:hypothetical protein
MSSDKASTLPISNSPGMNNRFPATRKLLTIFVQIFKNFSCPPKKVIAIFVSICDIWQITFCLTIAKYLPMSPKGETVRQQTKKFCLSRYKITKCLTLLAMIWVPQITYCINFLPPSGKITKPFLAKIKVIAAFYAWWLLV